MTTPPPRVPAALRRGSSERPARDTWWDAVRGVCILGVIWTHTHTGIPYADGPHAWNLAYWLVLRQLINFPVAVFVFLAAFFVTPSRVSADPPGWLRSRAVRLGVPFVVWSLGYTLLVVWIEGAWAPGHLARDVVLGASVAHLYFIVVLLQLVLLTPLLLRVLETRWRWLLWAVTPVFLAGLSVRTLTDGAPPPFANTWCLGWFGFYLAGLWVRRFGVPRVLVGRSGLRVAVGTTVTAVVVSTVETFLLVGAGADVGFAAGQLTVGSVLSAFAVIGLLLAVHARREARAGPPDGDVDDDGARRWSGLARLGRDSYGVYYVHMLWIVLAWQVLELPGGDGAFPVLPVLQLVEIVVVLGLSLLTIAVTRRVLGRSVAARVLGF